MESTIIQPLCTLIVGLAGFCIAYQQYSLSKHNYRIALYRERVALYKAIKEFVFITKETSDGDTTDFFNHVRKVTRDTAESIFIFDQSVHDYVTELIHYAHGTRLQQFTRDQYQSMLPTMSEKDKDLFQSVVIEKKRKFDEVASKLDSVFFPYLKHGLL